MSHYTDQWNGRHKNQRCTAGRCHSWAVVKYSVRTTGPGHGYMTIGYYCKWHIEPVLAAYPEDNVPQPKDAP